MTGRERVEAALRHQETDRVPIDFGGRVSGISALLYDQILDKLGLELPVEILDTRLWLAKVQEEVLDRFQVDTRYICQKAADSWEPKWNKTKDRYLDEWGILMGKPKDGFYFDYVGYPLADAESLEDIKRHPWPDVSDMSRNEGLLEQAEKWRAEKDPFILTSFKGVFEQAWALRGMENLMIDLYEDREFAEALLDQVLEVQKQLYGPFLELLAPYLGMVCFTDDIGGQRGLLMSREMYHEIIFPRHQELIRFIREKVPGTLVAFHCCGSVIRLMDEFVELGIDVLNPIQVTAKGMDIQWLKENYGDKISFWGAIDTQNLLLFGTRDEVQETVYRTKKILGKGGGYLYAPCHDIQAMTPADNILAMFLEDF